MKAITILKKYNRGVLLLMILKMKKSNCQLTKIG